MKIYLLTNTARQIEGDMYHFMIEYASKNKNNVETRLASKARESVIVVNGLECLSQRNIIEAELDD